MIKLSKLGILYNVDSEYKTDLIKIYKIYDYITIPKDFKSDGVTAPFGLNFIWNNNDNSVLISSIIHDYLYTYKIYDRYECDKIFYRFMKKYKYNFFKRICAFIGVRLFGFKNYGNHKLF